MVRYYSIKQTFTKLSNIHRACLRRFKDSRLLLSAAINLLGGLLHIPHSERDVWSQMEEMDFPVVQYPPGAEAAGYWQADYEVL